MEALSVLMEKRGFRAIVALKGLPSTCKTEVALRIGRWANCPVICIQDFLGGGGKADYFEGAQADFSPPTASGQVDRHHRKAFTSLLNVAHRNLYWICNCVVIKSALNTPYELQQLLLLARSFFKCRLIILECKIRNKFLWKRRFESISNRFEESRNWSRPRSWKDIETALELDDDIDCAAHHLPPSDDDSIYVTWMGVDPFYDLSLTDSYSKNLQPLSDEFNDAIKYLFTVPQQELTQNPYVVDYDEFRRFLFDLKLSAVALKGRSKSLCKGDCVFRYSQSPEEDYDAEFCGVCQGEISRQPAYTCYFCVTALDQTCVERFPTMILQSTIYDFISYLIDEKPEQHPCKACEAGGKQFSKECRLHSCSIQHRLKFHLFPTILNHDFHQHFLSIQLVNQRCLCKACGVGSSYTTPGYGCKRCAFYCHMKCALLPLELKQVHGGHDHFMKLMYTRDAMEEEEDPIWCDYCYEDMDPELWFYACQECRHYVVHIHCSGGFDLPLKDPKMVKFVEQLQSQLCLS